MFSNREDTIGLWLTLQLIACGLKIEVPSDLPLPNSQRKRPERSRTPASLFNLFVFES